MACKYKYNNKWYSEEQVKKLIESDITKDDITLELLKNNSFVVEVNTATEKDSTLYKKNEDGSFNFNETVDGENVPTTHYSNLTVPGGTNYTENEISTPDIIPNIKGHAQFSTDNGIGWFRGDDQMLNLSNLENLGVIKKVPC